MGPIITELQSYHYKSIKSKINPLEDWWKNSSNAKMAKYKVSDELVSEIIKFIHPQEYWTYNETTVYEKHWRYIRDLLKKEWFR